MARRTWWRTGTWNWIMTRRTWWRTRTRNWITIRGAWWRTRTWSWIMTRGAWWRTRAWSWIMTRRTWWRTRTLTWISVWLIVTRRARWWLMWIAASVTLSTYGPWSRRARGSIWIPTSLTVITRCWRSRIRISIPCSTTSVRLWVSIRLSWYWTIMWIWWTISSITSSWIISRSYRRSISLPCSIASVSSCSITRICSWIYSCSSSRVNNPTSTTWSLISRFIWIRVLCI